MIQSNITQFKGNSFGWLNGFGFYSSINTTYYVTDYHAGKVYILNDNWSYASFKTFTNPAYMITVGTSLYLTGDSNIWKLDKDLNTLCQYVATRDPFYNGLYYNSTNNLLYVAPYYLTVIHIFDLNLNFSHSFSILTYNPWSITGYNNQLYIGTNTGLILVIQNENILNQFNGCGGNSVLLNSILFDDYGYMATSCSDVNKLYLLFPNATSTSKIITTPLNPEYIGFDSKGRFIIILINKITIYN